MPPSEFCMPGELVKKVYDVFLSFCLELPMLNPKSTDQQRNRCKDELERLVLWADGFSAHDGHLDAILSRSSALRYSVLLILLELGNAVCNDLFKSIPLDEHSRVRFDQEQKSAEQLLQNVRTTLQDGPHSSDFQGHHLDSREGLEPDLDDVLENITTFIDCLIDLSLALEKPMIDVADTHPDTIDPAEAVQVAQPDLVAGSVHKRMVIMEDNSAEKQQKALSDVKVAVQDEDTPKQVHQKLFAPPASSVVHTTATGVLGDVDLDYAQPDVADDLDRRKVVNSRSKETRPGRAKQRYNSKGERLIAGVVPMTVDKRYVMMIQSTKTKGWILPKGGWETDEECTQAAERNAWEEAGILVRIDYDLGDIVETTSLKSSKKRSLYRFYEVTVIKEERDWPGVEEHERKWMTYIEAKEALKDRPELREALDRSTMKR